MTEWMDSSLGGYGGIDGKGGIKTIKIDWYSLYEIHYSIKIERKFHFHIIKISLKNYSTFFKALKSFKTTKR